MNSNNKNMNGSQNNKTTDSSNKPKNVTVNHYHYYGEKDQKNRHHHRHRNNNRGKKNNKQYDNNLNNIKQQSNNIFNNPYINSLSNNPLPNNNPIINNSLPNTNPVINGFTGDTSVINIGTNQFYKDTNGHIGIGAVPSAWGSLNKGLDLKGYTGIGEIAAVNSPVFSCNAYHNGSNWVYKNTNPVSFYQLNGNQHDWYIAPSGTAGTAVSPVAAMGIDASANLSFNSGYGSSAKAYGCRAWVNYNQATGAPVIRGSANVSSLTDLGGGQARVNFTTAMPDVNSSVVGIAGSDATNTDIWHVKLIDAPGQVYTGSFKVATILTDFIL